MGRSVRLVDIAVGGGVAVSAWVFADTRSAGLVLVTVLAGVSGLVWRRPVWALSLALVAVWVARGPVGLSASDSWGVALAFVVAGSLGAFAPALLAGVGVLLLSASIAWTTDVSVLDLMWVGLNLGGVAVLQRSLRGRAGGQSGKRREPGAWQGPLLRTRHGGPWRRKGCGWQPMFTR